MCSSRKYPYLPYGRDFFLISPTSHPSGNSSWAKFDIALNVLVLENPPPPPLGNSIPFCRDCSYFKVVFSSLEDEIVGIDQLCTLNYTVSALYFDDILMKWLIWLCFHFKISMCAACRTPMQSPSKADTWLLSVLQWRQMILRQS